jgi:hypothetical protein
VNLRAISRLLPKVLLFSILVICQYLSEVCAAEVQADHLIDIAAIQQKENTKNGFLPKKLAVGMYFNKESKLDSFYIWGEEHKSKAINFQVNTN